MSDKLSTSNVARLLWSLIDAVALPNDWDSYGAVKVSRSAARSVADFLRKVPSDAWLNGAKLVPLSDGGLQMEFCRHAKLLDLEFQGDGQITSLKVLRAKRVEKATFPASCIDLALTYIDWLNSD